MNIIRVKSIGKNNTKLFFKNNIINCQIGKRGFNLNYKKKEGDFTTPKGKWNIERLFYRRDKIPFLKTHKSFRKKIYIISKNCCWCDDIFHKKYNKHIKIRDLNVKNKIKHEALWREDDVYDIIFVLNYNTRPIIKGKGSAIFMHCSFKNYRSTRGCVAIEKKFLKYISNLINKNTILKIS